MIIYVFKRLDKKGYGNANLTHFEATAPPRVGESLNIFIDGTSSNYLVEKVFWHIDDEKGLKIVEVFCKDIGWK
jgi:hypothetical protein